MRRVLKDPESKTLQNSLNYIPGNSNNNKKIAKILMLEQKRFCAYTDEYLSRTDARDIEHFNPTLKDTPADNYNNWFLVKHQWNKEKSYRWDMYQPVLHPTAADFEERVVYNNGDYIAKSEFDTEAVNLVKLLQLDDLALADKRKKYIARKREEIAAFQQDYKTFFTTLLNASPCQVSYLRAIREEFSIDLWQMLE
jgi:hypothetical protein